jgi:RNA polymerase sigma factor (sigma-70 family)
MDEEKLKYEITSDTILWNSFRSGDNKSFENIYRKYVKPLYHYSEKFTNDKDLVLDCIQELFVDLFIHRQNLGETNNIKFYLFISLKRKILGSLRKNIMVQAFPEDELPFLSVFSTEEEVYRQETDIETLNRLNKALGTLSPRQKEAIYLRFVVGLQYEEICLILEMNYQSVRNLVYRAIEKLRKSLICFAFLMLLVP